MKFTILCCAVLCLSMHIHAQAVKNNLNEQKKFDNEASIKVNSNSNLKFDNGGNKLKVTLIKDSLFVTDKDLLTPVATMQVLDSLIKKLPQSETLTIEFESRNANPEKIKEVDTVLKQCRCHITRHSISFDNSRRLQQ
jgi:hypothetical protein